MSGPFKGQKNRHVYDTDTRMMPQREVTSQGRMRKPLVLKAATRRVDEVTNPQA